MPELPTRQVSQAPLRSAFYIDGFNLYHAIDELRAPFLKWYDPVRLANLVIPQHSETLVRTCFFTAFYPGDPQKRWRHEQYLNALRSIGVECVLGHYVHERQSCRSCGATWQKPTEKETDINLALRLVIDGFHDLYDKAYLVSADSDQAATAARFRECFPTKQFVTVSPPGRPFSVHISKYADARLALNREHIERCLLPAIVHRAGMPAGRRPREYDPPVGWVPPQGRR